MSSVPYRSFDLGAARVAVHSPVQSFQRQLDFIYRDYGEEDPGDFADVRLSLLPGSGLRRLWRRQIVLWSESSKPFEPHPLAHGLPLFEWGGNWLLAQRLNAYLLLHAGVLARGEHAVILPAAPGSGKSTLSCALHLAGWRFLSDEFGVIDPESGEVLPLLKPAALKNQSIEIICAHPQARLGPVFPGTRKGDVAHFTPDAASIAARHQRAQPRLVVFPQFRAGASLRATPIPAANAALRLGLNSFNYRTLGSIGFHSVVRLARNCPAYELEYSSLKEAIAHINALLDDHGQR